MGFVLLGMMTLSPHRLERRGAANVFARDHREPAVRRGRAEWFMTARIPGNLSALEGMNLSKTIPFAAVTFVIASVASMGLPGFSGFIAELQVIIGAWQTFPALAIVAGIGIVIGVAYSLRVLIKSFFSEHKLDLDEKSAALSRTQPQLAPISFPEKLGAAILIATTLAVGLYPRLLLDLIMPSFNSPLMQTLWKGGQP